MKLNWVMGLFSKESKFLYLRKAVWSLSECNDKVIWFVPYLFVDIINTLPTEITGAENIFCIYFFFGWRVNNKIRHEIKDSSSYFKEYLCIPASPWSSNELAQKSVILNGAEWLWMITSVSELREMSYQSKECCSCAVSGLQHSWCLSRILTGDRRHWLLVSWLACLQKIRCWQ